MRFVVVLVSLMASLRLLAAAETLRYSINWPTGLSLGEATMSADNIDPASSAGRKLEFRLEASIPGFAVFDEVKSMVNSAYCAERVEKSLQHGRKQVKETLTFTVNPRKMERKTEKGGLTRMDTGDCPKDALGFIYLIREELRRGRLPAPGAVFFGAAYQVEMKHAGSQALRIGSTDENVDKFLVSIQGPASKHLIEAYYAKDAARTPVLFRVPLPLGAFSMELLR